MEQSLDSLVEKTAKDVGESANALVGKALRAYLEWNVVSRKFGLSTVPRPLLNRLIEHHTETECIELGRWIAKESVKPFAEYQFGELSVQSCKEVLKRFGEYGSLYEFDETRDGEKQLIFLKHGSGPRWSSYYVGLVESVYKGILGRNVKTETTDEICIFQINLSDS